MKGADDLISPDIAIGEECLAVGADIAGGKIFPFEVIDGNHSVILQVELPDGVGFKLAMLYGFFFSHFS